jgi:hypothetical protein
MNTNVVWSEMLNNRFLVKVTRIAPYLAELTVTDKGVILHQEDTPLTFDATFGGRRRDLRRLDHLPLVVRPCDLVVIFHKEWCPPVQFLGPGKVQIHSVTVLDEQASNPSNPTGGRSALALRTS